MFRVSSSHFIFALFLFGFLAVSLADDQDDFAEFDEDEEFIRPPASPAKERSQEDIKNQQKPTEAPPVDPVSVAPSNDDFEEEEEAVVENENEQEQYDPLEFEGFEEVTKPSQPNAPPPELKIAKVPVMLGKSWEHYYVEYLLSLGLGIYLVWYATGKSTNSKLAAAWLSTHIDLLRAHFALVGDDGTSKEIPADSTDITDETSKFIKEADHVYTLWCSGRTSVEGMVVTLRLKKRQDFLNSIMRLMRPTYDQVIIRVYLEKDEMDPFVLCVGKKNATSKLQKELSELPLLCPDRKSGDRFGLPSSMSVYSEIGESVPAMLDTKIINLISKHEYEFEYLVLSDQFVPKADENAAQPVKRPDPQRILQFCFNLPKDIRSPEDAMNQIYPLCGMALYFIDKVIRFRLSREAKTKAEKNRQKIQEDFLKSTHAQRQEAAQLRREEKRRAEKEKILSEEDPEKQRKWEERDYRRELKKRGPKVKAMKVKS